MKHIIIATDCLLHWPSPDKLDWAKLANDNEILLLIAPVSIRELAEKKQSHRVSAALRARAAERLSYLLPLASGGEKSKLSRGLSIAGIAYDPMLDFKKFRLSKDVPEDWLIATCIEYRESNPAASVCLATDDASLLFKAPAHQIEIFSPPAERRLVDEADASEKPTAGVRKPSIAENVPESVPPQLLLTFKDGQISTAIANSVKPDRRVSVDIKQWEHDKANAFGDELTLTRNENYPTELKDYLAQMGKTYRIDLMLSNKGEGAAQDVVVELHVPDGVRAADELPAVPTPTYQTGTSSSRTDQSVTPYSLVLSASGAQYKLDSVESEENTRLGALYLTLNGHSRRDLTLSFELSCKNRQERAKGSLTVNLPK